MIGSSVLMVLLARCVALEGEEMTPVLSEPRAPVWETEIGNGFVKHSHAVEVKLARAFGTTETGSIRSHNLWLAEVQSGWMLTDILAPNSWLGGNLEGIGVIMGGGQDHPEGAYFVGLNGGVRYHFRTHTRFDPFVGGTVGIGGTDVGEPDLGGTFQFNEQVGAGTRFFLTAHHALSLEYSYLHVSNGGIRQPNDGINAHMVSIGFAWLF